MQEVYYTGIAKRCGTIFKEPNAKAGRPIKLPTVYHAPMGLKQHMGAREKARRVRQMERLRAQASG
jgi:hypothetical protein